MEYLSGVGKGFYENRFQDLKHFHSLMPSVFKIQRAVYGISRLFQVQAGFTPPQLNTTAICIRIVDELLLPRKCLKK